MNVARRLLGSSLGIAVCFAIACTSSSSGNPGNGSSSGSGSGGGSSGGDDAGDSGGGSSSGSDGASGGTPCNNLACGAGQVCCVQGGNELCMTSCPDGGASYACTVTSGCNSSQTCCVYFGVGSGQVGTICASPCPSGTFPLCKDDNDCPMGEKCVFMACAPVADGGPAEGGGMPPVDAAGGG